MKSLLQGLFSRRTFGVLGLIALSLLVWFLGPLIAFGDARPFEAVWVRVLIIVLVWAVWGGLVAWRAMKRRRTNAVLLKGLSAGPSASDKEAQLLAQRFDQAVARLKASRGRSWAGGGQQLYELPWYMFIGAPGSGKTTALLNAGLQFLLGDGKGGKDEASAKVKGVGGTRNCEWWFTQDAVLIDTAGRYATQDSDQDVDASAWDNFLALLKKTRPRQPINGVLLTVNVQDLLQQGPAERAEHAARLRARLGELHTKLGLRPPVYVLVTKADLIGGFNESFEALNKEEREQVWGFTLPPEADGSEGSDLMSAFPAQMQALQQRLVQQLVDRLEGERDVLRRGAIFAFPQELAAFTPLLGDFLRQVFAGGGTLEAAARVRGLYFTSGTQEGSPIDRVMGSLGRSFGIDARAAAIAPGRGKSFFLHRLLKNVVFAERGLGTLDLKAERRRHALRITAMAAMGVLATAVIVGWAVSRARNLDHAAQVAAKLPEVKQAVATLPPPTTADVSPLPLPLATLRDAARTEGVNLDDPPLLNGLGLYQGDKLDAGAQIAYHRLLGKTLAPRVARRLEEQLRSAGRDNLEQAYESLKAYLMLHEPANFDAASLQTWVAADWDASYPRMAPDQRAELDRHLAALLAQGAPRAVAARDDNLVAGVREMLVAFPLEYRVLSRIKRQWRPGTLPDFTAAGAAGPNAAQVFRRASGEPLTQGISGLFTRDGYRRHLLPAIEQTAPQLAREESWVLGLAADPARLRAAQPGGAVHDRIRRLYFEDYIKTWDAYLAEVRLVPLADPDQALAVSRLLAAVDSPMTAFLRAAAEQTTLVQPATAPGALDRLADRARADAARLAGGAPAGGSGEPLERMVDDHFAGLHRLFAGDTPAIAETRKLFEELFTQLAAADAARKSGAPPPAGGGGDRVKIAAAQQPPAVRALVEQMADATTAVTRGVEIRGLAADLKPITDFCHRAITNRYPFASASRADVLPEDFGQLFGQGGLIDSFFQQRLAPLVDTTRPTWAYRPLTDGTRPVTPAALADFQRAQRIREVFFRAGGQVPAMRLELRLSEIEPSLRELRLDIDGQVQTLTTGGPSVAVSWPAQRVATVIRLSTALGDRGPLVMTEGPWALFRLFDRFEVEPSGVPERFSVVMNLDGRRARVDVIAASVFNPFQMREIRQFRCPAAL